MANLGRIALSSENLADRLIARGLIVRDKQFLVDILNIVSYYRFKGYLYPFRIINGSNDYRYGTTLDVVWELYSFDRKLRLVAMDALSRIEVAVRAALIAAYIQNFDNEFAYLSPETYIGLKEEKQKKLVASINKSLATALYKSPPPVWAAMDVMSFGTITYFYQGLPFPVKQTISSRFQVHPTVFSGWLMALKQARNICAHHSRFWNQKIKSRIAYKSNKNTDLINLHDCLVYQAGLPSTTIFSILSLCAYMLGVLRPQSNWRARLKTLLSEHPAIPLEQMGFPKNWESLALWQDN